MVLVDRAASGATEDVADPLGLVPVDALACAGGAQGEGGHAGLGGDAVEVLAVVQLALHHVVVRAGGGEEGRADAVARRHN